LCGDNRFKELGLEARLRSRRCIKWHFRPYRAIASR